MREDLPYIAYKSSNKTRAKENRYHMTKAEQRIRFKILQQRPAWYKFIRQKMIGSFILDFYCSKLLLGIEIDGDSHIWKEAYDKMREGKIRHKWIKIIRYTNDDVFYCIEWVFESLLHEIKIRKSELSQ
jgi:very-short-patch-repair endonuclease